MNISDLRVHHIGYLVKNIQKGKRLFETLGYSGGETVYDKWRNVDICFLVKDGYRIELVSPRNSTSAVGELRKKVGNSPYHICYEVEDLEKVVAELGKSRFVIWEEPYKAPAINGNRVAFLINGQIGMIELVER